MKALALTVLASIAMQLDAQTQEDLSKPGPWKRQVITAKGSWFDSPGPHPLSYFMQFPMLRDENGDFCYLCAPEQRLQQAKAASAPKAEIRYVGKIRGLTIYDVFYRFKSAYSVDWKSILVKTGTDKYREIYHCQPTQVGARALPSTLSRINNELMLHTRYLVGGNKGFVDDDYYAFQQSGPIRVNLPAQSSEGARGNRRDHQTP